eukprot:313093_1
MSSMQYDSGCLKLHQINTKLGIDSTCKCCRRNQTYQRACTQNGFYTKLLCNAKSNQIKRYNKKNVHPPAFTLTKACLDKLYAAQGHKGYYSHIPLTFKPLSDWQ